MERKTKILVTGAAGFVGRAIVSELEKAGKFEVCGFLSNRKKIQTAGNIKLGGRFEVDIADYGSFPGKEVLQNTEILIHSAGLAHQFGRVGREDFWSINVQGTVNICRLAQKIGVKHFILISSVSVYGDHGSSEIDENFECCPSGFYAESKLEAELKAIEFCESNKIQLTILRLATVVGEGDAGNIARLITLIDKGLFIWVGSGDNKKSLIYKADVARGVLKTVETPEKNGVNIYNLTGGAVPMKDIVRSISQNLHKKMPRLKLPERVVQGIFKFTKSCITSEYMVKLENTLKKWLSDDIFSGKRFNEKYNFNPETTVQEALGKQVKYYLSGKKKK